MNIKEVTKGKRKFYYKASFFDVLCIKYFKLMVAVDVLLLGVAVYLGLKIVG